MKLIVGLGNPEKKYHGTRHNAGFIFVDALVEKKGLSWAFDKKFNALVAKGDNFIFAKPQTFMNKSGESVSKLANYFGVELNDLVVVHDDVDLKKGKKVFKREMSSAGHHGVEDIIEKLGSNNFFRIRIGLGRPKEGGYDVEDYVLGKLEKEEIKEIESLGIDL